MAKLRSHIPTKSLILSFWILISHCSTALSAEIERTVCGGIKERLAFSIWSSVAGKPDSSRVSEFPNIVSIQHTTEDDRVLGGYKIHSNERAESATLILQGNAMLADQIIENFLYLQEERTDVYIYDWRGYGRSEGNRRLLAIISDQVEILQELGQEYAAVNVYAMSFGGVVLLSAIRESPSLNRVVVDSTPSIVSDQGCPEEFDPIQNLPADASNFTFITGKRDKVVDPARSRRLILEASRRGASTVECDFCGHPFMDRDAEAKARRYSLIKANLFPSE